MTTDRTLGLIWLIWLQDVATRFRVTVLRILDCGTDALLRHWALQSGEIPRREF